MSLSASSAGPLPMLPPHIDGGVEVGPPRLDAEKDTQEASAFEKLLQTTVLTTNEKITAADDAARDFASGKSDDIHGTMIAVTEADIQLRLLGTMKNKVVEAFYELWRMQI